MATTIGFIGQEEKSDVLGLSSGRSKLLQMRWFQNLANSSPGDSLTTYMLTTPIQPKRPDSTFLIWPVIHMGTEYAASAQYFYYRPIIFQSGGAAIQPMVDRPRGGNPSSAGARSYSTLSNSLFVTPQTYGLKGWGDQINFSVATYGTGGATKTIYGAQILVMEFGTPQDVQGTPISPLKILSIQQSSRNDTTFPGNTLTEYLAHTHTRVSQTSRLFWFATANIGQEATADGCLINFKPYWNGVSQETYPVMSQTAAVGLAIYSIGSFLWEVPSPYSTDSYSNVAPRAQEPFSIYTDGTGSATKSVFNAQHITIEVE